MYRLLIVDDEQFVVNSLASLLMELDAPELDICKAYSGIQALEMMEKTRVDIVLSDICMPGMTGIELMRKICEKWPHCKILFLTGHNDFDYIYTAVKNDAVTYLLKTEDDSVIIAAIKKAAEELDKEFASSEAIKKAEDQEEIIQYFINKQVMVDLIRNGSNGLARSYGEMGKINFDKPVAVVYARVDQGFGDMEFLNYYKLIYSIHLVFEKILSAFGYCTLIDMEPLEMLVIIQPRNWADSPEDASGYEKSCYESGLIYIKEMLETIQEACKQSLELTVSMMFYEYKVSLKSVLSIYDSLKQDFQKSFLFEKGVLVTAGNEEKESTFRSRLEELRQGIVKPEKLQLLELYLERGQKKEFFVIMKDLEQCFFQGEDMDYEPAIRTYLSVSLVLFTYINKCSIRKTLRPDLDINKLLLVSSFSNWKDAVSFLERVANEIVSKQSEIREGREEIVIEKITGYIEKNLSHGLSLVSIADYVHYNPSYLSRYFRQITGKKLQDYIMEIKIKKAKKLLEDRELNINDISFMIGFESPQSFATAFKRAAGVTPSEYRNGIM